MNSHDKRIKTIIEKYGTLEEYKRIRYNYTDEQLERLKEGASKGGKRVTVRNFDNQDNARKAANKRWNNDNRAD